ncbi:fluoride efflux transporter FluC [Enemella evansiae]|uniref:fluoride efflux transporter FluC n=1 Tax=Enemella evansiae TaxID=2016499 RepID=UPI000B96B17F|nr:CrcB family protein [Enemella evansiae]OYN99548.1 chromosome condensation protein CrcB [Enemella evansiae]
MSSSRIPVLAVVAAGGALGSLARWGLAVALPHLGPGWPWSTLIVNLTGSLLLGVLIVVVDRRPAHRLLYPFLGVGVLGGWTTFSTMMTDVAGLVAAQAVARAGAYLLVSLVGGLLATGFGIVLTRRLLGPL